LSTWRLSGKMRLNLFILSGMPEAGGDGFTTANSLTIS
jgi:hypothetical protein